MEGIEAERAPTEMEMLEADFWQTLFLLMELGGIDVDRAQSGSHLGAQMLMKRLEERGWRPESGWE